jgi:hypothetical protein
MCSYCLFSGFRQGPRASLCQSLAKSLGGTLAHWRPTRSTGHWALHLMGKAAREVSRTAFFKILVENASQRCNTALAGMSFS